MSVLPISRLNPAITVIAIQIGIFPVYEFADDVKLVVVGVEGAHEFGVSALMAEDASIFHDVVDFVATGPGVGFVFEVTEGDVGELFEKFSGLVSRFVPRDWPAKGARLKQDVLQHGYYSSEK
jgi:hypothetical protein